MPPPSGSVSVQLLPWLPHHPAHLARMHQQRIACGWNADHVDDWVILQQTGAMNMFWVVLSPLTDPASLSLVQKHLALFPDEALELYMEAASEAELESGREERGTFTPVGHISLVRPLRPDHKPGDAAPPAPRGNPLIVSNLYVSPALQGSGIGNKAMDALEVVARGGRGPEWKAGELQLFTIESAAQKNRHRYEALGLREMPKVTLQDWYERRGYVVYQRQEGRFDKTDATGKLWKAAAVSMKLGLQ